MHKIIEEIKSNLLNDNYLSALTMTLILPDICRKLDHPNLNNGERYVCWYNEYIHLYELSPTKDNPHNKWVPDGYVIYKLRCSLLHEGSLDIDNVVSNKKDVENLDDYKFILTNNFTSIHLSWEDGDKNKNSNVLVRIGVEGFCEKICAVAEKFYTENYPSKDVYNDVVIFDF